jgi:hypothetical protein
MAEQTPLSNNQVADIYQSMLQGDKNSLFKLQQVSNLSLLPHLHPSGGRAYKSKLNTEEQVFHKEEFHQSDHMNPSGDKPEFRESSSLAMLAQKK